MVFKRLGSLAPVPAVVLALAAHAPALAQNEACEAHGQIVDSEGNGIKDVEIAFWPKSNPHLRYTGKTNKKGRYFVVGMYTPQEGDMWQTEVSFEGLLPTEMRVESRTVNKVLIGDVMTQKLRAGSKINQFPIPRMGFAKVDFKMASAEELEQAGQVGQADPAGALGIVAAGDTGKQGGGGGGEAVAQKLDPWSEATQLASTGEFEASLPFFVEAIEAEPESTERQETYAKVLYQLERYDEALAATAAVVEQEPERFEAYKLMGAIQIKSGNPEDALVSLGHAAELAPGDVEVQRNIVYAATQLGDIEAEIAAYSAIAELKPDNAEIWAALGDAYHRAGREKESEEAYRKVVDLDPEKAYQTYYNLGSLIMNRADRDEAATEIAINHFRRATEIKEDYAPAYKQLGFALLGVGDRDGARSELENFLKFEPSGPEAEQVRAILKSL